MKKLIFVCMLSAVMQVIVPMRDATLEMDDFEIDEMMASAARADSEIVTRVSPEAKKYDEVAISQDKEVQPLSKKTNTLVKAGVAVGTVTLLYNVLSARRRKKELVARREIQGEVARVLLERAAGHESSIDVLYKKAFPNGEVQDSAEKLRTLHDHIDTIAERSDARLKELINELNENAHNDQLDCQDREEHLKRTVKELEVVRQQMARLQQEKDSLIECMEEKEKDYEEANIQLLSDVYGQLHDTIAEKFAVESKLEQLQEEMTTLQEEFEKCKREKEEFQTYATDLAGAMDILEGSSGK